MASVCDKEKNMTFGNGWDSEKILGLYIYNYLKRKGLHDAADIFSKEANLEMFEILNSKKGLLKEWWEIFWPQFSSRLANKAGGNSPSFAQSSVQDVLALLASLEKQEANSFQTPVGNPQHNAIHTPVTNQQMIASGGSAVVNAMEQPPASLVRTPPVINQHRADKCPVNTDTNHILGKLSAQAIGKGTHGFPPVRLLPTQLPYGVNKMAYTKPPPSHSRSNLHLPVAMQSPVQVIGHYRNDVAERSDQMESNRLGQNSTYPLSTTRTSCGLSELLKK